MFDLIFTYGRAFDSSGVGRAWPLLVGERGHLALQSGEDPLPYLQTIWRCSSAGGLLPEQVWDAAPMPLLWAHAEFLKLLVARERRRPSELLHAVEQRYLPGDSGAHLGHDGSVDGFGHAPRCPAAVIWHWRDEVPVQHLEAGRALLIEDRMGFTLQFGFDGWQRIEMRAAVAMPFGLWGVRMSAEELAGAAELNFTRRDEERWEGIDHRVSLGHVEMEHALAPVRERAGGQANA